MKPLALNSYFRVFLVRRFWRFPFSPNYRNIRSDSNQCGSVRAKYLRPPLKVVYIDRSCHFCRLDGRNVPVHLTKLLFPLQLICMILFASTITKSAMAWVGSVQPECTVPLGTWNSRGFKPQFFSNGKRPFLLVPELSSELQGFGGMPSRGNAPQKPALSNSLLRNETLWYSWNKKSKNIELTKKLWKLSFHSG